MIASGVPIGGGIEISRHLSTDRRYVVRFGRLSPTRGRGTQRTGSERPVPTQRGSSLPTALEIVVHRVAGRTLDQL